MSVETVPLQLQGPRKGECGCGCGLFGTLRVKPWANGVWCLKACKSCKNCIGKRSRTAGYRNQQRTGAKAIAGLPGKHHEEHDRFNFRWQNKTGTVAKPVFTAFEKVQGDDDGMRPTGDARPFLARFGVIGKRYGLVVLRDDRLRESWLAIGVQNGFCDEAGNPR